MSKALNRKTGIAAVLLAAGATAGVVTATGGGAQAASASHVTLTDTRGHVVTTRVWLASMPQGTVTLSRYGKGSIAAMVNVTGLTPGSVHAVVLRSGDGEQRAFLGTVTANALGQVSGSLFSGVRHLRDERVVLLNGTGTDLVTAEPIARTIPIDDGMGTFQLTAVEVSAFGEDLGTPQGRATVTYNPFAKTISVTVTATGLTPGAHAAHIHVGSCAAQGPVQYMLTDFTADASGQIDHETRTVANATTPLPATGWYLNLHQGTSANILDAAGNPTVNFRPLLCGNLNR
jgi:Cu/Zn superoxide dismutase